MLTEERLSETFDGLAKVDQRPEAGGELRLKQREEDEGKEEENVSRSQAASDMEASRRPRDRRAGYSRVAAGRTARGQYSVVAFALAFLSIQSSLCYQNELDSASASADSVATTTTPMMTPTTTTTMTTPAPKLEELINADGSIGEPLSENQPTGSKLKPVNFTLVDEIFESAVSEDEVVKRWRNMDGQMQDGMKSILKMIFPQIVSISQDAKVSGECSGGILKWILSLRNLRSWAIKMLDATGKPTAGVFEGSLTLFGNYRQCLNIRAPDEDEIEITDQFEEYFRGQFCVIHLKPWMPTKRPFYHLNSTIDSLLRKNYKYYEKTLYDELAEIAIAFNFVDIRLDLCVPSTCTIADIQRVAELLSKKLEMRAKVMRCDIQPREASFWQNLDQVTLVWMSFPATLLVLVLVATILAGKLNTKRGWGSLCRCLSMQTSLSSRLKRAPSNPNSDDPNQEDESQRSCGRQKPLALYGLRSLFVFWFLIVQMTVELKYQYLRESLTLRNMLITYWPFQIIVNSTILFESLILITAFTFSYSCLESTLRDLIAYVVDKYVRLVVPIVTLVAFTIVTPLLAIESPVWRNFVEQQAGACKSTGHLDLFFLQNFISYDKICLQHTWLFCVELQLIVLSIPLVLLLKKSFISLEDTFIIDRSQQLAKGGARRPIAISLRGLLKSKVGLLGILLIAVGFTINFFAVYLNQLPPSWFYTFPDVAQKNYYFGLYLTKTWTHLSVFMIGLLGGHLCKAADNLQNIQLLKRAKSSSQHSVQQLSPAQSSLSTSQSRIALDQSTASSSSTIELERRNQQDSGPFGDDSTSGQRSSSSLMRNSLQIASVICLLSIIFATFTWSTQEVPSTLVAALYDASSRCLWSLALTCLMIQLCLKPEDELKSSWSRSMLLHPVCLVLGRLSFLAYLLSPYIHTFVLAVEEQSLFPSLLFMFHVIIGNFVIIYVIAFILAILIEQPARLLVGRLVFPNRHSKFEFGRGDKATAQTIS